MCVTLNLCQVSGSSGKYQISFVVKGSTSENSGGKHYISDKMLVSYFLGGKEAELMRMGR